MTKVTLNDILSDYASRQKHNANYTTIETAFDNTVSRDGSSPNAMGADFDMNSHRILNLPAPASANEPVRLVDVADGVVLTSVSLITIVVDTLSAMKSYTMTSALNGQLIYIRGYSSIGDGGEGLFRITTSSPGTANDGTIVNSNTSGYYFKRQYTGQIISVRWFGAKGDSTTDDAASINAAISFASTLQAGQVYFPGVASNVYRVNSTITVAKAVHLFGDHIGSSAIYGYGMSGGTFVLDLHGTNLEAVHLSNLTFGSNNNSPDLIQIHDTSIGTMRNIGLRNARHGIVITGTRAFTWKFDFVYHVTGLTGSMVLYSAYTGGGQFKFDTCSFGGAYGCRVLTDSTVTGMSFDHCNFEGCTTRGFTCEGNIQGLGFYSPRVENSGDVNYSFDINPDTSNSVLGLVILGGNWDSSSTPAWAINIGGNGGVVRGIFIAGNWALNYSGAFVRLNGEGNAGMIVGNSLTTCGAVTTSNRPSILVINNEIDGTAVAPTEVILYGSATYDAASLIDGAGVTSTITVTGAALGDFARVSYSADLQGITTTAWVSAADTVSFRLQNETTGTLDLASGTFRARVEHYL